MACEDFPGGPGVKNLPANAGDTGSIPGPRKHHVPQSNKARAAQLQAGVQQLQWDAPNPNKE